jgi:hypothetical protein
MKIRVVGAAEFFPAEGRLDGQTDKHDEANSRFSQFCERAWKQTLCLKTWNQPFDFIVYPEYLRFANE